ncbi:amidohydrolase family protein [Parapedobacter sp. 10938]|uniref:amidohydrolase family protein n=1 Tax=Parapedobacter flavus TaxID=3110225 RepID=UPI002DB9A8A1|nr:amidohydrolase family protein [Parapedobacter sp. 10938]MEC3878310.1 amidohydrolase family protein [Parapedobacter sp. 10938]
MIKNRHSRRDFIKNGALAGMGLALANSLPVPAWAANEEPLMFFDGFTNIGPKRNKHPAERWSLKHLVEEMGHCSISGALVASVLSVTYDPMYSNLELSKMLKPYPYLFAVWNLMPANTGEFPAPAELGRLMKEHDVRAVTVHPAGNNWDWHTPEASELLNWLRDNRILTIVRADEFGGLGGIKELLNTHADLPILLTGVYWSAQRTLLPMLGVYKSLHISFDNFQINEGLETLYADGYIDQLVYASNAPTMSIGAHRTYVDYAAIPKEARDKIAGGNLIRLLHGQRPPAIRENKSEDILMSAVRHGKPVPTPIIDMHMHMLHEGLNGTGWHYRMHNGGPSGVFELVKRLGYCGGGIMSWNGVVSVDSKGGNVTATQALDAAPPGYWGLANFDPVHYTQEELAVMIPEVYKDKRFIGMKPYVHYGVPYHDPSYDIWWKYGNEHQLYGLLHNTRSDLQEVETLAPKYPNVRWVIAHAGSNFRLADMAIKAMNKYPNVYAEITLTTVYLGIIEYLIEGAGEDRILYGSDLPMRDPRQQLGWAVFTRLPLAVKKKLLGGNALHVIKPKLEEMPVYNIPENFRTKKG